MIILVDDRTDVTDAYRTSLGREGVSTATFTPSDFDNWFHSTSGPDLAAVEAFVLGDFANREHCTRAIKTRTEAPAIALNDSTGLETTLKLFAAGVDDRVVPPRPAYPFFYKGNVLATERLVRLAVQAGVQRAVIFSSYFLEFERRWPELRLAEKHPYIRSRVEQEQAALAAAGSELNLSTLLLPYIFGSMPGRLPLWKPLR